MKTLNNECVEKLRALFGSHAKVAQELGVSTRHYARIRKGQHVTPTIVKLVEYLANKKQ